MNYKLVPRFYYSFTFKDFINSFSKLSKFGKKKFLEDYFGTSSIYFTNYGRTGLKLLLSSVSTQNRTVGLQPFTCPTVIDAIIESGYKPIYIDVTDNYSIDPNSLEKRIKYIDILLITHTFGIPADIKKLLFFAGDKIIIEDCAHSLFSTYQGKPTGLFGDASIFSFGYGKYPSIGPGGFVVIKNKEIINEFKKRYYWLPTTNPAQEIKNIFKNYIYSVAFKEYIYGILTRRIGKKLDSQIDLTGKYSNFESQAYKSNVNIFIKKFSYYQKINEIQKKNGDFIINHINEEFDPPKLSSDKNWNYYVFPLRHDNRDQIVKYFQKNGIDSGKHFSGSLDYVRKFGYENGSCPNFEKIINTIFTIPVHSYLKKNTLEKIITLLQDYKCN
jgi:dTDP-4-amino-4,6-dideoxygalactose transaminase